MHLDEERIERLLSGELPEHEARILRQHLSGCATCARAFEAATQEDREIAGLLNLLDHPAPRVDPGQLAWMAGRRLARPRLVAAGIALLVVAGAASAMPGSPVRSWLSRVFAGPEERTTAPLGRDQSGPSARPPAGVSVLPAGDFELVFEAIQESGVIRISLADQAEVTLQSEGEGVGYSVEPHAVRVLNAGSGANYQIVLPRDAESISIRLRDTIVFQKQEKTIVTSAARDAVGRYVVEFSGLSR